MQNKVLMSDNQSLDVIERGASNEAQHEISQEDNLHALFIHSSLTYLSVSLHLLILNQLSVGVHS